MTRVLTLCVGVAAGVSILFQSSAALGADEGERWVGTWATSSTGTQISLGAGLLGELENQTVRQIVPTSIGGSAVRLRFSNARGDRIIRIADVHVGLQQNGAVLADGSNNPVTFGGRSSILVSAGASVLSDAVTMRLASMQDLAVTFFVKGPTGPLTTGASGAVSYLAEGNVASAHDGDGFTRAGAAMFLVSVDVMPDQGVLGAVVTFGDSITAGGRTSWPGVLASRFLAEPPGRAMAVLNYGIGGMRLLRDSPCFGESGLERFAEVLLQPNVRAIIVFGLGGNDIRLANQPDGAATLTSLGWPEVVGPCFGDRTPVTAEDLIGGLQQLVLRAHAQGIKIFWNPITPFGSIDSERAVTVSVNEWARTNGTFDGVFDVSVSCTDSTDPWKLLDECSGDNLHPNTTGARHFANAIDLSVLIEAAR